MLHSHILHGPSFRGCEAPCYPSSSVKSDIKVILKKSGIKVALVSQSTVSCGGMISFWGPCKVGNHPPCMLCLCCDTKRPFCNFRIWTSQFKTLRGRLPSVQPLCHGEMEIVSVKDITDGFVHLSFGASSISAPSSKVKELSSAYAEHIAGKVPFCNRLPSQVRRQSPICVVARRKKRQVEGLPNQQASNAATNGPAKLMSRPKSSFVKRSPIPQRKDVQSEPSKQEAGNVASSVTNFRDNALLSKQQLDQGPGKGKTSHSGTVSQGWNEGEFTKEGEKRGRLPSRFICRSPMTAPVFAASHDRQGPSLVEPKISPNEPGSTGKPLEKHAAAEHSRPKSKFVRRSPIPQVEGLATKVHGDHKTAIADVSSQTDLKSVTEASGEVKDSECSKSRSEPPPDLDACKLSELKSIAKARGLSGYSKLKKGELLDLLKKAIS